MRLEVLASVQRARRPRRRLGDREGGADETGARLGRRLRPELPREPRAPGLPAAAAQPIRRRGRRPRGGGGWPPPPARPPGRAAGESLLEVRSEETRAGMLEPGARELATRLFEELM